MTNISGFAMKDIIGKVLTVNFDEIASEACLDSVDGQSVVISCRPLVP